MKKILLVIAMIVLTSCSTTIGNKKLADSRIRIENQMDGVSSKTDAREKFGTPNLVFQKNNLEYYEYRKIYGAGSVNISPTAQKQLEKIEAMGFGSLPVCMAKNQYSLSDDPSKLGRPQGFELNVREAYVSAGAGFVVVLTGTVMTMPGLSKTPAAYNIDVDENGKIVGLF